MPDPPPPPSRCLYLFLWLLRSFRIPFRGPLCSSQLGQAHHRHQANVRQESSRLSRLPTSFSTRPPRTLASASRSRETLAGYSLSLRFRCANEKSCQLNIASYLASVSPTLSLSFCRCLVLSRYVVITIESMYIDGSSVYYVSFYRARGIRRPRSTDVALLPTFFIEGIARARFFRARL